MPEGILTGVIIIDIFLVIIAILWFLLPFAVFGTKSRLDKLIDAQDRTNMLLELMLDRLPNDRVGEFIDKAREEPQLS